MKKVIFKAITLLAIFALGLSFSRLNLLAVNLNDDFNTRKIVVFKPGVNDNAKEEIINRSGGIRLKNLDLIGAKVVHLPNRTALEKLANNPFVLRVDEDVKVEALVRDQANKINSSLLRSNQVLPWGIDRIDAELVWPTGNTADPVKVGIIDTGISTTHPDLLNNIKGGINTINPLKSFNDDNGHGTHVAGIVAALNNNIGVVGVAPKADLYAIKVLNSSGSGYLSDVIEGIQWAIANHMQVINMSLGTSSDVQSLHEAIIAAKNAGIVIVAAAGNSGSSVTFPAAYDEVIAVTAIDQNNQIASWSSRGKEVDLAAPGVSIYSTYKGKTYATLSGTSMAAPHVTGAVALLLNTPAGNYDFNGNGKWDPDEVQKKLQDKAVDLGDQGFDNFYGWGLVNAYQAVQP